MANVELKGLEKAFGAQIALKEIDLAIADGEFLVIVGPSGCGKSTLLRIIAGLEQPTKGDVLIEGQSALSQSPAQRGVAMVFQSYALYPHLNVRDNMAFGLRMAKKPEAEVLAAVVQAAQLLGIEDLLDRRPKALSGGQRQRVAIGRAIVRQPRLFLLDEPLSNLDAGLRVHMRHEFARLHRELATTMIYVTHDQVEAMTLASRLVVLNAGGIEQVGTPTEVYNAPRNLFVASFLGSPRMNLLAGEIRAIAKAAVKVKLTSGDVVAAAVEAGRAKIGDRVTLGIRPDTLGVGKSANGFAVTIDVVETLGGMQAVYCLMAGMDQPVCALLSGGHPVRHDDALRLCFAARDAYLFDAEGQAFTRLRAKKS
ncbi:sn-glycerol-3-phosphate ABC transporter ATP-binding protein UgpC [Asticcacaulis sp.]|uniref:ABC transporter ATP-binding protein n=1 Tax=Asticcacaulis sp. TaxID=1872648 RepID=UPI002CF03580|nr:sn-glycerol-3-phosphate ABC transporter ATP-binding protein UgpC [Asticcacaulis sp.]HTM81753.1 sn-glycerol-3-phosphate ABC transporter ATP-binding protein UgpC [Asticcacaulis sp.]